MSRRYRPNRRNNNPALPVISLVLVLICLCAGAVWMWGGDVVRYFKGETIYCVDNSEANLNLENILRDLSGDKSKLLDLAEHHKTRLGWVKDDATRRRFLWILMTRLIDKGQWDEAVRILPEVEALASEEGLDRLATAALQHEDFELQLRLDHLLQEKIVEQPAYTEMLLRSLRRTTQTCLRLKRNEDILRAVPCLDRQTVLARLTDPKLAAEAASLQMIRASLSTVPSTVHQKVRNILAQAKWPLCPATSQLMLEEVTETLQTHQNLTQNNLKEIESKLLRCRDSMLEYPDREHRLPKCYMLLGEIRFRIKDYEGCTQALTLAGAFAEGYGEMNTEMQVKLCRLRSRANEARGALGDVVEDCRYLLAHDTDGAEQFRALGLLAGQSEGVEKVQFLTQAWDMLAKDPKLAASGDVDRAKIARELADYYKEKQDFPNAIKWVEASVGLVKEANPDLTDGKYLQARYDLALLYRKAKLDAKAVGVLVQTVRAIENMDAESRSRFDAAAPKLYINGMRELARTYLLQGDRSMAKDVCKKAHINMPDKVR